MLTASAAPRLSLVLPTYNERRNLPAVVARVVRTLEAAGQPFEIIVVDDDSPDETWRLAEELGAADARIRVVRRIGERGLATAVVAGWRAARGEILAVMDADLQYPPESLHGLLAALADSEVDVAVGSRWSPGATLEDWSAKRWAISRGARLIARLALPSALGRIADPGAGYFMVRRRVLEGVDLRPRGFKILIEVLARGSVRRVVEVGQQYEGRKEGESKLRGRQVLEYLEHLLELSRDTGELARGLRRAAAAAAAAVLYVLLAAGLGAAGHPPVWAGLLAAEAALLVGFLGADGAARPGPAASLGRRLLAWHAARAAGAAAGVALLWAGIAWMGLSPLASALVALLGAAAANALVRRLRPSSPADGLPVGYGAPSNVTIQG